ncbi:unnamed protein product [Ilex paraguariensis]|uniref:Uncharacterized protein n=1 Tax=Ilex paraguariensis TaxID=185542 RepID=A0ABC8QXG9_9AQUA
MTYGYLDTVIDRIPGMKGIRLNELPAFIRITNPKYVMLNFAINEAENSHSASAIVLSTIDVSEHHVLEALAPMCMEITDLTKEEVERLVSELMAGEKGKEIKRKAMEWKKLAEEATSPTGSSYNNYYDKVVAKVLLSKLQ